MDQGVQGEHVVQDVMFDLEELGGIPIIARGNDFIQVQCGLTIKFYGDFVGKLTIHTNGKLEIACACYNECKQVSVTPAEFLKNAGVKGTKEWESRIWVVADGNKKLRLKKTKLLKYFTGSPSDFADKSSRRRNKRVHRDEFITCKACHKVRRFTRRTKEECWVYHQAFDGRESWVCTDFPNSNLACEVEEERVTKKQHRGCKKKVLCTGCTSCVCFGCDMCRFKDCFCRLCSDFYFSSTKPKPGNN